MITQGFLWWMFTGEICLLLIGWFAGRWSVQRKVGPHRIKAHLPALYACDCDGTDPMCRCRGEQMLCYGGFDVTPPEFTTEDRMEAMQRLEGSRILTQPTSEPR